MKKIHLFCLMAGLSLALCAGAAALTEESGLMECVFDKAMYKPGETAVCRVEGEPAGTAQICAELWHLNEKVLSFEAPAGEESFSFMLPKKDFTGYLLTARALNAAGETLARGCAGVDCASSWTRFPRYGYVWDYTEGADARQKIEEMSSFHLNGVQYYDWQYRHHLPLAKDLTMWRDWSGRRIYGDVLRAYLSAAHENGMVNMAYNMIYAANKTYLRDKSGVDAAWRLLKANGEDFTVTMSTSLGATGILQYFNPLNKDWQNYIFARENEVFSVFAFDGWHGDTIGENGRMTAADGGPLGYDADGKPIYLVKDCYTRFLNAAKAAIGEHYLVFNPVGAQGIRQVNQSDVDVLYAEFWPWDANDQGQKYDDYASIQREIFNAAKDSGGKSLVVAGYVNYKNSAPLFNAPAVLLMDAVCFSAGGARLELGDGGHMLSNEYFPDDHDKTMDAALRGRVVRMYDFITAYENLLRDGQRASQATALVTNAPCADNGRADAVWCFTRENDDWLTVHLINLVGTDDGWRDEAQTKNAPVVQKNLAVRVYTDREVLGAWAASPDESDLSARAASFTCGVDGGGRYVEFSLERLEYWDMVFLRYGA